MHFKTLFKSIAYSMLFFFLLFSLLAESKLSIYIKKYNKTAKFEVEIADTKILRKKGLMFRSKLEKEKGMLFIFPNEQIIRMWMKNTMIPLDILFISKDKVIVDIIENAKEMSDNILISKTKSKYVLEINSGLVKDFNITIGDSINFEKTR